MWVAHWTKSGAPLVPAGNWGGLGWTFWQWTDCASGPGFINCVDGDRYAGLAPGPLAIGSYATGVPVGSVPPTIVGAVKTGSLLTAIPGTWSGGKPISFTYQWQQCVPDVSFPCFDIPEATGNTYLHTPTISTFAMYKVVVTARNNAGTRAPVPGPTGPCTWLRSASGSHEHPPTLDLGFADG